MFVDFISVIQAVHKTRTTFKNLELNNLDNPNALSFIHQLENELENLVPKHFINLYQTERLPHLIRYLKALSLRAERGIADFERAAVKTAQVSVYTKQLNKLLAGLSEDTSTDKRDAIEALFWLIEEYKVSLFAQELKTPFPVSEKRLQNLGREIERMV